MVIVLNMSTGKHERLNTVEGATEEFGNFVDEVLNAGWLPQPAARLEPHPIASPAPRQSHRHQVQDTDTFLRDLYRNQE